MRDGIWGLLARAAGAEQGAVAPAVDFPELAKPAADAKPGSGA
jgi:hypothetical protein